MLGLFVFAICYMPHVLSRSPPQDSPQGIFWRQTALTKATGEDGITLTYFFQFNWGQCDIEFDDLSRNCPQSWRNAVVGVSVIVWDQGFSFPKITISDNLDQASVARSYFCSVPAQGRIYIKCRNSSPTPPPWPWQPSNQLGSINSNLPNNVTFANNGQFTNNYPFANNDPFANNVPFDNNVPFGNANNNNNGPNAPGWVRTDQSNNNQTIRNDQNSQSSGPNSDFNNGQEFGPRFDQGPGFPNGPRFNDASWFRPGFNNVPWLNNRPGFNNGHWFNNRPGFNNGPWFNRFNRPSFNNGPDFSNRPGFNDWQALGRSNTNGQGLNNGGEVNQESEKKKANLSSPNSPSSSLAP